MTEPLHDTTTVGIMPNFDADVVVVGSGFGGATTALRLTEAGHKVIVLERGKRLSDSDPAWAHLAVDWKSELATHYERAARMLGRITNSHFGPMDDYLREAARTVGAEETFGPVPVAIHFGREGVTEPDPFFGGEGPARTGCRLCGECLFGCPYGAKNQLTRNYLHLAERYGAEIRAEHDVTAIAPIEGGGYEVSVGHPWKRGIRRESVRARRVVLAGGVLGTLDLLFRCRDDLGTLPHVSSRLGKQVRTNSEALTAIQQPPGQDLSHGPNITSDFHPDADTHVTQNRYVGGWHMRFQIGPIVDGHRPRLRAIRTIASILRHPFRQVRAMAAHDFEQRLTVLTVMQRLDNEIAFEFRRSPFRPWRKVLRSRAVKGREAPSFLPVANEVTRAFAEASGGVPFNLLGETLGGLSVTAHVLGGAAMGANADEGVVDSRHEVFGHTGLYVADASTIPANLGVNPSLTITAMAERFAAGFPEAPQDIPRREPIDAFAADHRRPA